MTHLASPRVGGGRWAIKPLSTAHASANAQHKTTKAAGQRPYLKRATQPKPNAPSSTPSNAHVWMHMVEWLLNPPQVCNVLTCLPGEVVLCVRSHTDARRVRPMHDHGGRLSLTPHAGPSHGPCAHLCHRAHDNL